MIAYLKAKLMFKAARPIEFEYAFQSVRMQGDMPDFKAIISIDKFGNCSSEGAVLKLENANLQYWFLTKSKSNSLKVYFAIAGRIFEVSEKDELRVADYFVNIFPHRLRIDS